MIYIVRHGQTNFNVEGRIAGQLDVSLNSVGIKQSQDVAKNLRNIRFDYVFSSPLKRAYDTAKIISSKNIIIDERLIERCNGELEGKLKNEIKILPNYNDKNDARFGIESLEHLQNRVNSFFDEILKKYCGKNILVVTHAGVIINIRCYFEGEPKCGNYDIYKAKNCEIIKYNN